MDYKKIYESSFNQTGYNLHPDNEFRFQFVNDYIKTNEINSIIDIGSGRGNILKIIKETYPNVEVTSTDIKKFHNIFHCSV
jgi:methylase of polypeptide subunit release factors